MLMKNIPFLELCTRWLFATGTFYLLKYQSAFYHSQASFLIMTWYRNSFEKVTTAPNALYLYLTASSYDHHLNNLYILEGSHNMNELMTSAAKSSGLHARGKIIKKTRPLADVTDEFNWWREVTLFWTIAARKEIYPI